MSDSFSTVPLAPKPTSQLSAGVGGRWFVRAVRISLKEATAAKLGRLEAVLREHRAAANAYARALWITPGRLDRNTLDRFAGGSLGFNQRRASLETALDVVSATRKSAAALGREARLPQFRRSIRLNHHVVTVERGRGSFDYALKVSSLVPGRRIVIPFKAHARLRHWLERGGEIRDGATFGRDCAWIYVRVPEPVAGGEAVLGVDFGVNYLVATSDGDLFGSGMRGKMAAVRRAKPGSRGKKRAIAARNDYINATVNRLPFGGLAVLGVEDLTGIRFGRKRSRGKNFRKAVAPWAHRRVLDRLTCKAQENRVRLVLVSPMNTSRECPACGAVAKENRVGEDFRCVACNHGGHADLIGARNVLARTTRALAGPSDACAPTRMGANGNVCAHL
jgi:Putative transposase DNA-binding domain